MQNKLAKIEGTNFTYRFLYNSRNERIAIGKSVNAAEMTWRYDACNGPVCIAVFNESADVSTYFVRGSGIAQGIGDVIAEVNYNGTSEEIHYYLYNHRGDVVCVVNPGSTPNTTYRYDAYGRCYENYGSYTSRYTFSTKEYLPEADLYLYQYRVYDPQAGRWTQRDPIDYQDSINLYQFCGNNPVNNVDPYGLKDREPDENTKPKLKEKSPKIITPSDIKENADSLYNCYSHVFYGTWGDGSPSSAPRAATDESAKKILEEDYDKLDDDANNKRGDVVAYYREGKLVHVGIIKEVDDKGYTTEVESKFGLTGPLVLHHPRQTIDPETNIEHYKGTKRVYYRLKPMEK